MQTRSFSSVPTRAIHTATQISMIMKTFSIAIRVGTWHTSCYFSCSLDICNILKEVWLACAFCLEDSKSHMDHRRGLFCDTWNDLRQFFCHHKKIRYWAIHFMSVKGKWVYICSMIYQLLSILLGWSHPEPWFYVFPVSVVVNFTIVVGKQVA
jgi:hypothetical protein